MSGRGDGEVYVEVPLSWAEWSECCARDLDVRDGMVVRLADDGDWARSGKEIPSC